MQKRNLYQHDAAKIEQRLRLAKCPEYEVCIWGAGFLGRNFGRQILEDLGIKIDYYCDNNEALRDTEIVQGIYCRDKQYLAAHRDRTICFLFVRWDCIGEVDYQLADMGVCHVVSYDDLLSLDNITQKYLPFFSQKHIAVYACITGDYDELREPEVVSEQCDYYIISDKKPRHNSVYQWVNAAEVIPNNITDNILRNRYCKMHPHKLFGNYRYSIYHDGNVRLMSDLSWTVEKLGKTRISVAAAGSSDSVFVEALHCIAARRTDMPEVFLQQAQAYWNQGMPYHFATYLCNVIVREHNHPLCVKLMEEWWEEFVKYSRRDQISIPYVIWKNGFAPEDVCTICGEDIDSCNESPYWEYFAEHKKSRICVEENIRGI